MTSADRPGGRPDLPGAAAARTDPNGVRSDAAPTAVTEPPARPEPPGTRGVIPGWSDRAGAPELPKRHFDGGTTATDPRGPRLDHSGARTDPRGMRPVVPDGALSLPPTPGARPVTKGPRRARLTVRHIDPWSVLKFTLLFSLCMLVVGIVAVAALYYALDRLDVFDQINEFVKSMTVTDKDEPTGGLEIYFQPRLIIGGAAALGAVNAVILTALATLAAFLYNLVADVVGGIEVVLAERD